MSKAKLENIEQSETLSAEAQEAVLGGGTKGLLGDDIGVPLKKPYGPDVQQMERIEDDEFTKRMERIEDDE